jgi:hypothetical protein
MSLNDVHTAGTATATPTDLLHQLRDRAELNDLILNLGRALDEHRFDDLDAIFTEDVTGTTPGGAQEGRTALIAQAVRNHEEFDRLQHLMINILITFDGDGDGDGGHATIRADLLGTFGYAADPQPARQLGGVYTCRAVHTPDGWRINTLEVRNVWRVELATPVLA